MARQKFRKVIPCVKACRPRGRREEAVAGVGGDSACTVNLQGLLKKVDTRVWC